MVSATRPVGPLDDFGVKASKQSCCDWFCGCFGRSKNTKKYTTEELEQMHAELKSKESALGTVIKARRSAKEKLRSFKEEIRELNTELRQMEQDSKKYRKFLKLSPADMLASPLTSEILGQSRAVKTQKETLNPQESDQDIAKKVEKIYVLRRCPYGNGEPKGPRDLQCDAKQEIPKILAPIPKSRWKDIETHYSDWLKRELKI